MKKWINLPLMSMATILFLSGTAFAEDTRILKLSSHMQFGSVNVTDEKTRTLTVFNKGNSDLHVTGLRFHDKLENAFTGNFSGTIPPNGEHNVTITFRPQAGIPYSGLVYVESDRTNTGDRSRACIAKGVDVDNLIPTRILDLGHSAHSALTFDDVTIDETLTQELTIHNNGNADLHITGLRFHERLKGAFSGNFIGVIPPNGERNVTISFTPTMQMLYEGLVYIESDRTNNGIDNSQPLRGNGVLDLNPPISLADLRAKIAANEDVTNVNTSAITDMSNLFKDNVTFNQDISGWDVSAVTNMEGMFENAITFNQDLSGWNVGAVLNMKKMFSGALAFNQDLSGWNVGAVLDMSSMFANAITFNGIISDWDVSSVTNFGSMFSGASLFNQPLNWNLGSALNLSWMFNNALAFNQPLNWNVGSVIDMRGMFSGALNFNQNLGGWNISLVQFLDNMLDGVTLSTANYDALLNGWSLLSLLPNLNFNAGNSISSGASAQAQLKFLRDFGWSISEGGISLTLGSLTAMLKIVNFAIDGSNPIPTLADYLAVGVAGVTAGNLDALNLAVDALSGPDISLVGLNGIVVGLSGAVDTENPDAKLARPLFENGDTIPTLNNQIEGADMGRTVKLDATASTDNVGVTTYTFMQNTSGTVGIGNYDVISGCENIIESTCNVIPTNVSGFNTLLGNWAVTYYRVKAFDAAGNSEVSGNRYVRVKKDIVDTTNPDSKLARPLFANGDTIPTLDNQIEGADIGRAIKLDATASTDNVGVTKYTFMQNTSGTAGNSHYTVISGCENITEATCEVTPTNVSGFNTLLGNWAVTYYKVKSFDAAGNENISGNRYVRVKKDIVDTANPNAKLARPLFANGDNIPTLNNQIKGANIGRAIKLDAGTSTDNVGVTKYTFMQNTSGTAGNSHYTVIPGCENITESTCELIPTNVSGFSAIGNWAVTYYKVKAFDAVGNENISGNRYVRVKK